MELWVPNTTESTHRSTETQQIQGDYSTGLLFFESGPGKLIHFLVYYLGCPLMMLVAISTNFINATVFLRGGLNDGMAINFLGLTISDLLYNIFYFIGRTMNALHSIFGERPYLNLIHFTFILAKYGRMWFNVSILLTVFAAIQKCACIAIPLTFRNFFTPRKSAITVATIYLSIVTYFLPFLTLDQLRPYSDRATNRTRLGYHLRDRELSMKVNEFVTYANRIVLPYISQGIVIVCVFTMTLKLRSAAKLRREMTSGSKNNDTDVGLSTSRKQKTPEGGGEDAKKSSVLNSKELRVIRSVNILCTIFIIGTTPQSIIEACALSFESFDDFGKHSSIYFFTHGIQQFIEISSTAVNIVVYYHFNSKYRRTFNAIFCPDKTDSSDEKHTVLTSSFAT